MGRGRDAEVVGELAVDALQAPGQRTHVRVDRERQADRVPGSRVRILTDDEHRDVAQRPREGAKDEVTRR